MKLVLLCLLVLSLSVNVLSLSLLRIHNKPTPTLVSVFPSLDTVTNTLDRYEINRDYCNQGFHFCFELPLGAEIRYSNSHHFAIDYWQKSGFEGSMRPFEDGGFVDTAHMAGLIYCSADGPMGGYECKQITRSRQFKNSFGLDVVEVYYKLDGYGNAYSNALKVQQEVGPMYVVNINNMDALYLFKRPLIGELVNEDEKGRLLEIVNRVRL